MGKFFRVLNEKNRQRFGLGTGQFVPTSNQRNESTFSEATEFAKRLKATKAQLQAMIQATKGYTDNLGQLFASPKPRVYDETDPGSVYPLHAQVVPLGLTVQTAQLTEAVQLMDRQLGDIITPIDSWLNEYEVIKGDMKNLEELRLEVDSRRRTVDELHTKFERTTSQMEIASDKSRDKLERVGSNLQEQKDHKQQKLDAALLMYKEMEQELWSKMRALIEDVDYLAGHLRLATMLFRDAFQSQVQAYGEAPPLATHTSLTTSATVTQPVITVTSAPNHHLPMGKNTITTTEFPVDRNDSLTSPVNGWNS